MRITKHWRGKRFTLTAIKCSGPWGLALIYGGLIPRQAAYLAQTGPGIPYSKLSEVTK